MKSREKATPAIEHRRSRHSPLSHELPVRALSPLARIPSATHHVDTSILPGEEGVTSERDDAAGQTPTQVEHSEVQSGSETQAQQVVEHNPGM